MLYKLLTQRIENSIAHYDTSISQAFYLAKSADSSHDFNIIIVR